MDAATQQFLLEEHRSLWRSIDYIDSTRNKMVVLYLAVLGAVISVVIAQARGDGPPVQVGLREFLMSKAPPVLLFVALLFGLAASIVVLMFSIQLRCLTVEYIYALNRVRRAFEIGDPGLHRFLVLPRSMPRVPPGTYGTGRYLHFFLSGLAGAVLWLLLLTWAYRLGYTGWRPPTVLAAVALIAAWLSAWWYREDVKRTVRKLWERCEFGPVLEEIDQAAYLRAERGESDNWRDALADVEKHWQQTASKRLRKFLEARSSGASKGERR